MMEQAIQDKLDFYRIVVQSLLTAYAAVLIANGKIDCYTVSDTKQDHSKNT